MNWDNVQNWAGRELQRPLFTLAGTEVSIFSIIIFALIIVISFIVSLVVQRALKHALKARLGQKDGTVAAILRLTHYLVMLIGLGIAMQTIGVDMNALFAAGAMFAIAIGFAMQNIVQNFVSGIILLIERSIKPSDIIEVDGKVIMVVQMGIRTTMGRTLTEENIIIPNSMLSQSSVKNLTLENERYWIAGRVGVAYSSDMKQVMEVLTEAARHFQGRVQDHEPRILLTEFGSSSVNFEVWVPLANPWQQRFYLSELNKAIWFALKDAGITIAFPQVDVHFDPPVAQPGAPTKPGPAVG